MNSASTNDILQIRRFSRMSIRSKQHYLVLTQQAGQNPNNSPASVQAEIEKRILAGKTDQNGKINLTDLDFRGVDASKLTLDKCNLGGVKMDSKTKIGRAVDASFDGCDINSTKFVGDINGSSFVGAQIKRITASEINASGCNFSNTIQFSNDFAGSNMIGTKWIKSNVANNSYENADLARSLFDRGEQTQCMFDGANMQGAKILNTGLERASLDRINGTQMELRPAARDEEFSLCGAHLERAKLNTVAAVAADRDSATVKDCKIVHDSGVDEAPVRANPFDLLNDLHHDAMKPKAQVVRPTHMHPAAAALSLILAA